MKINGFKTRPKNVYIENRDGNANVKTEQVETLGKAYQSTREHGIKIYRSRTESKFVDIRMINSSYSVLRLPERPVPFRIPAR